MRLDQFIQQSRLVSRKEAKRLLRSKAITVNGAVVVNGGYLLQDSDRVCDGEGILTLDLEPRYFMLHKPAGFVSSHRNDGHPSLFRLLDEERLEELHIAGRLDADTTGLTLITDDGAWSQYLTHPKRGIEKGYQIQLAEPLTNLMQQRLEEGVMLNGEETLTLPAKVLVEEDSHTISLFIREGRYHQVKRMIAAVGNRVEALHRFSIGSLQLDNLAEGEYRPLTAAEIESFYL